jgi:hypothetical protein
VLGKECLDPVELEVRFLDPFQNLFLGEEVPIGISIFDWVSVEDDNTRARFQARNEIVE